MISKRDYFEFWHLDANSPESEAQWQAKIALEAHEIDINAPRVVIFQEGWFEHIGPKPLYIKSRKELRAACKENNCTSDYAE